MIPVLRCSADPPGAWAVAARAPERALVRRRVVPFVHLLLAHDEGHALRYVSRAELDAPGPAFVAALLALDPLPNLKMTSDGWWAIEADDGLETARVCLPLQRAFAEPMRCAFPDARTLWLAPVARSGALLDAAGERWARAGTPISPLIYALGAAGPVPLPAEGELAAALRAAEAALAVRAWERQREALEALFDVAFGPVVDHHGEAIGVWPDPTKPALLAATERVFVGGQIVALSAFKPEPWQALDPPRVLVRPDQGSASA